MIPESKEVLKKIIKPYDPAILLLDLYSKELKTGS